MSAGIANVTLLVLEDINQQNKSSPYTSKKNQAQMKAVLVITAYTDALTNNEYLALPILENYVCYPIINLIHLKHSLLVNMRVQRSYKADQETNF